jgi:hypothetical protein
VREKLIRNQRLFARANESIRDLAYAAHITTPVRFLCECSDEECRTELRLTPAEWDRAHGARGRFVIARGHDAPAIERVVSEQDAYVVVEKPGAG